MWLFRNDHWSLNVHEVLATCCGDAMALFIYSYIVCIYVCPFDLFWRSTEIVKNACRSVEDHYRLFKIVEDQCETLNIIACEICALQNSQLDIDYWPRSAIHLTILPIFQNIFWHYVRHWLQSPAELQFVFIPQKFKNLEVQQNFNAEMIMRIFLRKFPIFKQTHRRVGRHTVWLLDMYVATQSARPLRSSAPKVYILTYLHNVPL